MQSGWASTLGAAESDAARNSASAVDSACMPQVNSTPSVLPHPPARAPPESVTHINGDRGTDLDCAAHRVRPQSAEPACLQSVGARSSFEVNDELMNTQKQLQESQALLAASLENARLWRDQYDGLHRKFEALRKDYEALQQQREPSEPIGNQSPKSPPVLRKQLTMEGMGFVPNNSTVLRRKPGEQIVPKALQRLGRYVMARSVVAYLRQQTLRKAMMNQAHAPSHALVFGSLNVDIKTSVCGALNLGTGNSSYVGTEDSPRCEPGGKGLNQATALANLRVRTHLIGLHGQEPLHQVIVELTEAIEAFGNETERMSSHG